MNIYVLVSGTLMGFFSSSCGWRQGDPLFSYLFVIVMGALSRMFSAMVSGGLFLGFSVGFRNVGAKHFPPCKANLDHLCNEFPLFIHML
jgi:hypothetical protein